MTVPGHNSIKGNSWEASIVMLTKGVGGKLISGQAGIGKTLKHSDHYKIKYKKNIQEGKELYVPKLI